MCADRGGLGAVSHAELVQDVGDMYRDSALADEQGAGDLAVTVALGEQGQHVGLPAGEVEPGGGGGRAGARGGAAGW